MKRPSRVMLIIAGVLTQVTGLLCLVLALASLPVVHDLHRGMQSLIASIITAIAAIVCGTLVYRGRLVPLALAAGVEVGFGIVLPRGGSAIGALLRILPADDAALADTMVTVLAIVMFLSAVLCVIAIPSAVSLQRWSREQGAVDEGTEIIGVPTAPGKSRVLVIAGVAVTIVALGVIVITAATGSRPQASDFRPRASSTSAASDPAGGLKPEARSPADANAPAVAIAAPPAPPSIDDFLSSFHDALAHAKPDDLAAVFDAKAFAFGVEANEIAEGRDAVVALLRHDLGTPPGKGFEITARFHQIARDGDVAWLAEELRVGSRTYVVTAVAGLHATAWTISALHWAQALPNADAYRLAREGTLAVPDAIPDAHDESPLAAAMRTAFASKPSFVAARSARPDAFNFGSAPGERIVGGEPIIKTFARIRATIHLHDAVKVGLVGERGGWGAANVDFTDNDRDGTGVTQTFRVLAAWVKEDAGWRIVSTQWSNPR